MLHPQFNQDNSVGPNGRGAAGRTPRLNLRPHPYQQTLSTRGPSPPQERSPAGSSNQILFGGSDYETSPGAESDSYCSFPNTPADTGGFVPHELDVSRQDVVLSLGPRESTYLSPTDLRYPVEEGVAKVQPEAEEARRQTEGE